MICRQSVDTFLVPLMDHIKIIINGPAKLFSCKEVCQQRAIRQPGKWITCTFKVHLSSWDVFGTKVCNMYAASKIALYHDLDLQHETAQKTAITNIYIYIYLPFIAPTTQGHLSNDSLWFWVAILWKLKTHYIIKRIKDPIFINMQTCIQKHWPDSFDVFKTYHANHAKLCFPVVPLS